MEDVVILATLTSRRARVLVQSQIRESIQDLSELVVNPSKTTTHLQLFDDSQGTLERRLMECGYGSDPSIQEMFSVLKNQKTRFATICQLIASVIVRNVEFTAGAEVSLLPLHITEGRPCYCLTVELA